MDPISVNETVNQITPLIKNIILGCTSAVTLASLITAWTKTPNKFSKFSKLYKIIEKIGLVVGNAKQPG